MTKPNKLNYFKTKAPLNTCHVDEPDVVGLRLMVSHSATKYHHLAAKHHCRVPVPHTRWAVALPPQQVLKKAESVRHGWGERNKEPGKTRQKKQKRQIKAIKHKRTQTACAFLQVLPQDGHFSARIQKNSPSSGEFFSIVQLGNTIFTLSGAEPFLHSVATFFLWLNILNLTICKCFFFGQHPCKH